MHVWQVIPAERGCIRQANMPCGRTDEMVDEDREWTHYMNVLGKVNKQGSKIVGVVSSRSYISPIQPLCSPICTRSSRLD
ncbi:hypothetical protein U9M48_012332 [Paspalum notatum var. saurae]|uniref:Uncharacterized protein n=1 Tax=Paspalum notatum var. saurae TaxID=547442 RepID=A0AAQ3SY21_PASNO